MHGVVQEYIYKRAHYYMEPIAMRASMASRSAPEPATGVVEAWKTVVVGEVPAFTT